MTERATGELPPNASCLRDPQSHTVASSGAQEASLGFKGPLAVPRAWLHGNQLHLLLWMWCQNFLLMLDPERVSIEGSFL